MDNHIYFLGNFNTHLLNTGITPTKRINDVISSYQMQSIGTEPKFFYNEGFSQLDLILTNSAKLGNAFQPG